MAFETKEKMPIAKKKQLRKNKFTKKWVMEQIKARAEEEERIESMIQDTYSLLAKEDNS